ncbi:hypothetical protein [Solicola sp. PLA-1-18]|uniref:hypothetical protein n=1 Tax=Solicola sp. PLA-1-18 TaxID=3380532 RepID=UPI003B82581D
MTVARGSSSIQRREESRGFSGGRVVVLVVVFLGALGVYFGAPWVAAEADGAAYTHCMGYADEGEGFGTGYRAFPVAGVVCFTTSRPEGFYLGWAG